MFTDFQFGDNFASDFGLMVATFDSSGGVETVSSGSQLTFNTVKPVGRDVSNLIGTTYEETISTNFQLCKMIDCDAAIITPEEFGAINRWLNRKIFNEFKTNENGYENIRFVGSFNVQAIKVYGDIYGIDLTFTSNAPYGFSDETENYFSGKSFYIYDDSDEVGEIYPLVVITCNESGTLSISNTLDDEVLQIQNCIKGETITIDGENKIITSTSSEHNIANDFNYNFLKVINTYNDRDNTYTSSLNIDVDMKYSPIRKVGI